MLLHSQVHIAVLPEPIVLCCTGESANFDKVMDKTRGQKAGIQYHFNLLPFQVENLMHKPSFSVMGKINMFFMVRTLLVRLSGLLDQSRQYFCKVR